MRRICIITVRGGSKRIPKKNIRDFCGKPIIAYSIETALQSGVLDEVMVSTDDEEIAEVARQYGAIVPFMRSAETSGDFATTADVIEEVLACYHARGKTFDVVCCLYPTAPFVDVGMLQQAMGLVDDGAESVIPVTSFDYPPLRGFVLDGAGGLSYAFPEHSTARSQDLPEMVHDCGSFYVAKVEAFNRYRSFLTPATRALRIDASLVQDIDTLEDWEAAEAKFRQLGLG